MFIKSLFKYLFNFFRINHVSFFVFVANCSFLFNHFVDFLLVLQRTNQLLIFMNNFLFSIFKLFIISFNISSQDHDWTSFVENDVELLSEQSKSFFNASKSSFNASKSSFNAWNNLMKDSFKSTAKSSFDNFILFENRQFVIWTMNIENDFENWWTIDISWKIDTILRKREHKKLVWKNKNRKKIVWTKWHEVIDVIQNRSHVLCKNCDFVFIHSTFENIDNNIMSRHHFNNECTFKKNKRVEKQKFLKKSFQTIFNSFFFVFVQLLIYMKLVSCEKENHFFDTLNKNSTINC